MLTLGGVTVAAVICFEVAYDDVVRNAVKGGGQVLLVPSNNASYMGTGQTYQQLAISRFRAVEHGRWTWRPPPPGCGGIDPAIVRRPRVPGPLSNSAAARQLTLADRLGAWPEYLFALLGRWPRSG